LYKDINGISDFMEAEDNIMEAEDNIMEVQKESVM